MRSSLLAVCALIACTSAFAATQAQWELIKTKCDHKDDADIVKTTAWIGELDKILPNIPPEEQYYLKAESESAERARGSRAKQMTNSLQARPLYAVYVLRGKLDGAQAALKHIIQLDGPRTYPENVEAERLDRAASALRPISRYSASLNDYYGRQVRDDDKNSDYYKLGVQSLIALLLDKDIEDYIGCKLAKVTSGK